MKTNYDFCLNEVLKSEGGFTNDSRDPGGPTNFGITIADYRKYINKSGTATDVKNMSVDQAKTIYKAQYWDSQNCDALPSGVDYTVFDYGVNSGIGRSIRVYNKFKTTTTDPVKLINLINDERLSFLQALSTWPTFGKGWASRVARVRHDSISLAHKTPITGHTAAAGGVVVAGSAGTVLASHSPHHWPWIVGGLLVAALITYVAVKFINKGK